MKVNLNTEKQFRILAQIIEKANHYGYELDGAEVGYNENSGYVWLWSDYEQMSLGLEDFNFNPSHDFEQVEFILCEPFEGEEFFGTTPNQVKAQYKRWAAERLEAEEICESDIPAI